MEKKMRKKWIKEIILILLMINLVTIPCIATNGSNTNTSTSTSTNTSTNTATSQTNATKPSFANFWESAMGFLRVGKEGRR